MGSSCLERALRLFHNRVIRCHVAATIYFVAGEVATLLYVYFLIFSWLSPPRAATPDPAAVAPLHGSVALERIDRRDMASWFRRLARRKRYSFTDKGGGGSTPTICTVHCPSRKGHFLHVNHIRAQEVEAGLDAFLQRVHQREHRDNGENLP